MSLWDKPDLNRVRNAVLESGFKAYPVRSEQFRCQCPVHQGIGHNVTFKLQPTGKISFKCYSQDCSYGDMLEVLDLTNADFYPDSLTPSKRRPVGPDPSLDDWCLVTARDNRKQGIALTRNDLDREVEAFRRRRAGVPSPEFC